MNRALLILLISVLAFGVGVSAQPSAKTAFFFGGGFTNQLSPDRFKDNWNTGINIGGGLEIKFNTFISLVPRVYYNTFSLDNEAFLKVLESEYGYSIEGLSLDGGSMNAIDFGADAKLSIPKKMAGILTPYFIGGVGLTNIGFSDLTITSPDSTETRKIDQSETDFALDFGFGLQAAILPTISAFIEFRYVLIMADPKNFSYIPIHVGISLSK
ncbi:MAG: outer membrane beta-barrel protein [Candidatus Zixiibacteriota bacterium]